MFTEPPEMKCSSDSARCLAKWFQSEQCIMGTDAALLTEQSWEGNKIRKAAPERQISLVSKWSFEKMKAYVHLVSTEHKV